MGEFIVWPVFKTGSRREGRRSRHFGPNYVCVYSTVS
jgi:hypothetical protein